ncbi:MAG: L-lactate dehydrogenase [Candidatus Uhrbacteria bacterium]
MNHERRKITIIGAGFVGSTCAYSLIAAKSVNEIALIGRDKKQTEAQAMDLQHSVPFWGQCQIYAGDYRDIKDSEIVIVAAGAAQKPGETRLDLIKKNSAIISDIGPKIFKENPNVLVIMVTNPVDLLTYQMIKMFPKKSKRIIGSGTILDTARLRYLLGQEFKVSPRIVHSYIIGEHGDSEFPLWSTANIGEVPILDFPRATQAKLDRIFEKAKTAAYVIIEGKQATYYAIAAGVRLIVDVILENRNSVLPVSNLLTNYNGVSDMCLSVPCIIGRDGIREQLILKFNKKEIAQLKKSADKLKEMTKDLMA